jgi:hypothetical protein
MACHTARFLDDGVASYGRADEECSEAKPAEDLCQFHRFPFNFPRSKFSAAAKQPVAGCEIDYSNFLCLEPALKQRMA